MNPLDMFIIVVLAYCLIRGIFRGLVKELSAIVGVLAGFYLAYTQYKLLSPYVSRWISSESYANILSFLVVFIVVFSLVCILGVVIKYMLNIVYMGWVDRFSGAGFGVVKGVLISAVLLVILTTFLPQGSPIVKNSVLSPHVARISENMVRMISTDMKRDFIAKMTELKKTWKIH